MEEIWGKEIEKLIHKEVWINDLIVTLVQNFCKDCIAVIIMQTYVRGGNDPAEFRLRQSLFSGGKFDLCRCAVAHMMRTASSQSQWEIISKGTKTSRKIRGTFSTLPANDMIANARR